MFRSFAMDAVLDDVRTTGRSAYSNAGPVERVAIRNGLSADLLRAEVAAFDTAQDSGTLADLADYIYAAICTVASGAVPDTAQCDHMHSLRADIERVRALLANALTLNDL